MCNILGCCVHPGGRGGGTPGMNGVDIVRHSINDKQESGCSAPLDALRNGRPAAIPDRYGAARALSTLKRKLALGLPGSSPPTLRHFEDSLPN